MAEQNSTRVAVATSDGKSVDLHFGQTRSFLVLDLFHDGRWSKVREEQVEQLQGENTVEKKCPGCPGHDESHMIQIAQKLSDCKYLLLEKIGGRPSRILLRYGIEVLEQAGDLEGILKKLSAYLAG